MSDHQLELLSALKDGELKEQDFAKLAPQLYSDSALRQRWDRYHLIGQAMRNNLPAVLQHDLASRVSAALQNEPTILSPESPAIPPKVVHDRSFTGYAVAASVAVVGFLTVGLVAERLLPGSEIVASAPPTLSPVAAGPNLAASAANLGPTPVVAPMSHEERAAQLRSYIIHHEFSGPSMSRPLPSASVRVVTFPAQE